MKFTVINNILHLPILFNSAKNDESMFFLLKNTGYFENYNEIREKDIYKELLKYPSLIEKWLKLSEDKRASSGNYFIDIDNEIYVVGFISEEKKTNQKTYSDPFEACASFIKKEIEKIRKG